MSDEFKFNSGHEACRFAYSYSGQQYAMTPFAKLMRGEITGSGRGLIGEVGAAIAGTVKRHVETMRAPLPHVIVARYDLNPEMAAQCAVEIAGNVSSVLSDGTHSRRMVQDLVLYYFRVPDASGKPIKLATIADKYKCSQSTVSRAWRAIMGRMRELDSLAQREADDVLTAAGLIE